MFVTAVTETTRKKVKIEFDHQFTLVLYKGELKAFSLREGAEVPDDTIERIEDQILKKRATKYAMNLLVKKDYTSKELTDKLTKAGYTENSAGAALAYVSSYHYVDDLSYTRRYLETYSDRKSIKKMQMELRQKGICDELFTQARDEAQMEDESDTLRYYAQKKARSLDLSQDKDRQKLLRFLVGRGFPFSAVREMVEELSEGTDIGSD